MENRTLTQNRNSTTMTFTYDANGNRSTRTDYNGNVTSYTYDDLDRLTDIAYTGASGENASYTYDDLSRLLTAVNAAGTVTFTYDNRGRLATEEDVFANDLEYTYDAAGRKTSLELNNVAHTAYAYDNANRLTTLTDEASNDFTFTYDNANKLLSRVAPNGVTSSYEYDGMSRLKRLKHYTSGGTLYDDQFTYNTANQIGQIAGLAQTRVFTYDNIDRLTGVSIGGTPVESYTYDAVGNRTASHLSSSYTTGAFNRLTATDSASYSYNNNGSMTGKTIGSTSWTYGWDRENKMVSASDGTNSASYQYDALGRRVKRTQGSSVEKYTHDGLDVVLDDVNSTLTKDQNGFGIDDKLKQLSGGTFEYFLSDHLGSTAILANSNGASIDSSSYDSFGNGTNGSFSSRYQFTGRDLDPLTGFQFNRARFYDQKLGRFIAEDPIGFGGGDANLYGYVKNKPIRFSDPFGLDEYAMMERLVKSRGPNRSVGEALDELQLQLAVLGMTPGIGEPFDVLDGLISLARGDYVGSALSGASVIPFAGWGAGGSKIVVRVGDACQTTLRRPYIRKATREAVEATALRDAATGKFLDFNTYEIIPGSYDLGHRYGDEFWRMKDKAMADGLTQKEFNDLLNNPDLYRIELPRNNRSHKFEMKR